MSKKPINYTYEDKESGMVGEPNAALAYNTSMQPHMSVVKTDALSSNDPETDPVLLEMIREQEEAKNDSAWAEWTKGLTPEEWSAIGEYYDSMDENDSMQWIDADVAFADLEKKMKAYARKIGKDY